MNSLLAINSKRFFPFLLNLSFQDHIPHHFSRCRRQQDAVPKMAGGEDDPAVFRMPPDKRLSVFCSA